MSSIIYITGVPGAGKSTVLRELNRRGLKAFGVDEDHIAAFYTADGQMVGPNEVVDDSAWRQRHTWRIVPDRLDAFDNAQDCRTIYVCGSAANEGEVWSRFTKVVALAIDESPLRTRLATRAGNNFGKSDYELALALGWNKTYADDMRRYGALVIDSTRPVSAVVDELIALTTQRFAAIAKRRLDLTSEELRGGCDARLSRDEGDGHRTPVLHSGPMRAARGLPFGLTRGPVPFVPAHCPTTAHPRRDLGVGELSTRMPSTATASRNRSGSLLAAVAIMTLDWTAAANASDASKFSP